MWHDKKCQDTFLVIFHKFQLCKICTMIFLSETTMFCNGISIKTYFSNLKKCKETNVISLQHWTEHHFRHCRVHVHWLLTNMFPCNLVLVSTNLFITFSIRHRSFFAQTFSLFLWITFFLGEKNQVLQIDS